MRPSVSVVTATYKSTSFAACRRSVENQTYRAEHVIVDGGSPSEFVNQIRPTLGPDDYFVSEPDQGIYDALNKGIRASTSDIIGILHSDDIFASQDVVDRVVREFEHGEVDVVYGDLVYVTRTGRGRRYWRSRPFRRVYLPLGWMPPHPTLFIRKSVVDRVGLYDESFRISGDYEFILRLFERKDVRFRHLPTIITRMTLGGISNRSVRSIMQKTREDIRAMRMHSIPPLLALPAKNLSKVPQLVAGLVARGVGSS